MDVRNGTASLLAQMTAAGEARTNDYRNALYEAVNGIAKAYGGYHGYISALICIFGIFANALMIAVLIRPAMRSSVNALLASIAAAHGFTMLTYLTFTLHDLLVDFCDVDHHFSYSWQVFLTVHADLSVIFHSISLWLTVFLAMIRYLVLRTPLIAQTWNSVWAGYCITAGTTVAVTLFCFLNIFRNTVQRYVDFNFKLCAPWNESTTTTTATVATLQNMSVPSKTTVQQGTGSALPPLYRIDAPAWWTNKLENLNFWFVGILMKVLPCFLMAVFIALLIHVLLRARTRQKRLSSKAKVYDSTSALLLLIVFVFWLTQLPQGMMTIASAFDPFVFDLYRALGDILDLLSLVNSCVSFPIYCAMSQKFRSQFAAVFGLYRMPCPICRHCWRSVPQYNGVSQFDYSRYNMVANMSRVNQADERDRDDDEQDGGQDDHDGLPARGSLPHQSAPSPVQPPCRKSWWTMSASSNQNGNNRGSGRKALLPIGRLISGRLKPSSGQLQRSRSTDMCGKAPRPKSRTKTKGPTTTAAATLI